MVRNSTYLNSPHFLVYLILPCLFWGSHYFSLALVLLLWPYVLLKRPFPKAADISPWCIIHCSVPRMGSDDEAFEIPISTVVYFLWDLLFCVYIFKFLCDPLNLEYKRSPLTSRHINASPWLR